MAVAKKKKTETEAKQPTVTRAEKIKRQKGVLRAVLEEKEWKWNEMLEEAVKRHVALYGEEADTADLKGKLGSAFSVMEEAKEVTFDKKTNICALVKAEEPAPKKTAKAKKKSEEKAEETPAPEKKPRGRKKAEKPAEEVPMTEVKEETPAPKKMTRARKKAEPKVETPVVEEPKKEEPKREEPPKEEKKADVIDVSFFLGNSQKAEAKQEPKAEEKVEEKREPAPEKKAALPEFSFLGNAGLTAQKKQEPTPEKKEEAKKAEKPAPVRQEQPKQQASNNRKAVNAPRTVAKPQTEEETLKAAFLRKLRSLGGEYFEYYSVYLLERYSLKNGRRLEGLRISGGASDGGIDGEIELTDKFGFREVIYIQSKNWDPSKGDVEKWTVGETLLQQFIGAVACRQAKEGKRKCRGIFVTTSRFTEGAKEILDSMSADFIGYDGDDVFETAKECSFGLKQVNGKWTLDEKLLSGEKAFFELL